MFLNRVLQGVVLAVAARLAAAKYDPSSGQDWTQLAPGGARIVGSYESLPFEFGIVVNPYELNEDGEYVEPIVDPATRSVTTTYATTHVTTVTKTRGTVYTTSQVTTLPKPTHTAEVVHQIMDGQVQKPEGEYRLSFLWHKEEPCEEEEEDPCEEEEEEPCEDEDPCEEPEEPCEDAWEDDCDDGYVHKREDDCDEFVSPVYAVACATKTTLHMNLHDSILRDRENRIGSIVGSRQFQFDGPVPQYGAIYAAGWAVTPNGQLALGGSTTFYQCASGGFYNIYDQCIAEQCSPVTLDVVELIECEPYEPCDDASEEPCDEPYDSDIEEPCE